MLIICIWTESSPESLLYHKSLNERIYWPKSNFHGVIKGVENSVCPRIDCISWPRETDYIVYLGTAYDKFKLKIYLSFVPWPEEGRLENPIWKIAGCSEWQFSVPQTKRDQVCTWELCGSSTFLPSKPQSLIFFYVIVSLFIYFWRLFIETGTLTRWQMLE